MGDSSFEVVGTTHQVSHLSLGQSSASLTSVIWYIHCHGIGQVGDVSPRLIFTRGAHGLIDYERFETQRIFPNPLRAKN